jgi:sensor histidine kinase YesM
MKRYVAIEESRRRANTIIVTMVVFMSVYMVRFILKDSLTEFDWMFMAFVLAVMVMLFIGLRDVYKEGLVIPVHNRIAFDTLLLLVTGFIIEIIYFVLTGVYIVRVIEICLLIFSVAQYYLLVSTNMDNYQKAQRAQELEKELVQNKIKLMLGQIQPHFLYNALGTIRALCMKNPREARNALDYFAKFLRANMDSLTEEGCIPFEKELDHVKSYLYIEKLRFGDLLNVEFDIKATDFECPPLMLQTIVENAVKHGLMPKKEGGTIRIATFETQNCYEIKVIDNGVGYDTSKPLEEGRSHIGVDNTRQRVVALCHGSMNIGSRIGEGTTITIIIPKAKMSGGGYESNFG